jgi:transcriptional regulator with XRE-family HTH domain
MPPTTHRGAVTALLHRPHPPGEVVRIARVAAGRSQAELASRCGYSRSEISRWETGRVPLRDVAVLRALARVLLMPPEVFGLAAGDTTGASARSTRPSGPS